MRTNVAAQPEPGLERSCGDWVRSVGPFDGLEVLQAHFAGRGFSPHRHDTYGIGVTDAGVQTFDYRGSTERSLPGEVTVLHPDEQHDGRAGTDAGFAYHIVYLSPAHVGEALRALTGKATPLPFVRQAVAPNPELAYAVYEAFNLGIEEPLARDSFVLRFAQGLLRSDRSVGEMGRSTRVDEKAVRRAREYLDTHLRRVGSDEVESVSGMSRYELARQFRMAYGTSLYRYSVLRRLDAARVRMRTGQSLADVALSAGFSDQAHFTRTFTRSFGVPPGRYAQLQRTARAVTPGT